MRWRRCNEGLRFKRSAGSGWLGLGFKRMARIGVRMEDQEVEYRADEAAGTKRDVEVEPASGMGRGGAGLIEEYVS